MDTNLELILKFTSQNIYDIDELAKNTKLDKQTIINVLNKYNIQLKTDKKIHKEWKAGIIATKIKYDVDKEWYMQFEDLDMVVTCNQILCKLLQATGHTISTDEYKKIITKFCNDQNSKNIYNKWIEYDKMTWFKPSIDHIIPISKGGETKIENIRFCTWFENHLKGSMNLNEWDITKRIINENINILLPLQ